MAVTVSLYNHTTRKFANGENAPNDVYKVMLLNSAATFVASHTVLSLTTASGGAEVSGNGWTAGGEIVGNTAVTTITTNDAMFDGDDISVTATTGAIGPAWNAILYNSSDANYPPVLFISFGESKQADVGTPFKINWNANGIITFTYT